MAWSGTNTTAQIGPAGVLVPLGAGGGGGVALYDGANSITSGTAQFSNANGVTFGFNAQTVTASVAGFTQTNQTVASGGIAGSGFTTATTAGTAVVGTHNSAGLSLGVPAYITTYAAGAAATGISSIADSANTQTVGMLSFANSHGISFGISTGALTATITASAANAVPGISSVADSANTQTIGMLSFGNANGITFGLSTGANTATLTASANFAGLLSTVAFSASNTSTGATGLTFSNSNGLSFGLTAGTLTGSYTVPATNSFAGTASSFAGTNISGSMTLNTSGLSLALSAANAAAGNPTTVSYYEVSPQRGVLSFTNAAVFSNTSIINLQPFVVAGQPVSFYRGMFVNSNVTQRSTFSATVGISQSQGSTASTHSFGTTFTMALFSRVSTGTNANSSNLSWFTSNTFSQSVGIFGTQSVATNVSSGTCTVSTSFSIGYIQNIDSAGGTTTSTAGSGGSSSFSSTTNGASTFGSTFIMSLQHAYLSGVRQQNFPLVGSLSPGEYWFGIQAGTSSGNAGGANYSNLALYSGNVMVISSTSPIYAFGSSSTFSNLTNPQWIGSVSSAQSTTTIGSNMLTNNASGTWFNLMAATL